MSPAHDPSTPGRAGDPARSPGRSSLLLGWVGRRLLAALGAVLPLAITVYVVVWLAITAEAVLGGLLKHLLPNGSDGAEPFYIPGMGIAIAAALLLGVGISLESYLVKRALVWEDRVLRNLPLVRTIYASMKDLTDYFRRNRDDKLGQAVLVTLPGTSVQLFGFVTQQNLDEVPADCLVPDPVLVYLPMSYQIGGYTAVLPRSAVQPLDVGFDHAMSFVMTAGMKRLREAEPTEDCSEAPPDRQGTASAT